MYFCLLKILDLLAEIFISFQLQLFTDAWFLEAMDWYLQLRFANKSPAPTYVYLFTHKGAASFTEIFQGGPENYFGKNDTIFKIWNAI